MMEIFKYLGYALIILGVVDTAVWYAGTDIWGEWFGFPLEGFLYQWSGPVAIVLGGILIRLGGLSAEGSDKS
jgi:hypothetical protein